jgi:hypothetical protein
MRRERAVVGLTLLTALAAIVLARHAASAPVVRTVALGESPINVVVDPQTGHAFVATFTPIDSYGHMSLLDARSGALVRTVAAGFDPLAMAVDGQTGRAFAANFRDTTVKVAMAVDEQIGRAFVVNEGGTENVHDGWEWIPRWLRRRLPFLPPVPRTHTVPGSVSILDIAEKPR